MRFNLLSCLTLLSLFSCDRMKSVQEEPLHYTEKYRPQFHFSPDHNWTNDPNGLVYSDGEYHLFYQYNPYANVWGHMSWGHAVSKDLLHWEHLPVALEEYVEKQSNDSVMVFSGSAVVDADNTSGFFSDNGGGIVAIYTSHVHRKGQQLRQHQSIAYSKDRGRTFTRYENNPVLDLQLKDFRDPKVFWYDLEKKWVMAAVIPDRYKVHFFESRDLQEWKFLSEFGPLGDTAKIWECPDLFEVSMTDDPKKKWVLLISGSHPQGRDFVGMQYFVGDFDGKKFTPDDAVQYPLYLEYGKDFYAAITYNNMPDGRTILLGWANNWAYAQAIPTLPWKSAMSLPRELYLKDTPQGVRMVQRPIRETETLRVTDIKDFARNNEKAIEVEWEVTARSTVEAGLEIVSGEGDLTIIGVDFAKGEVFFDRTKSGNVDFHPLFPSVERVPVNLVGGKVKLRVFIDHSIVEVYVNDGEQVLTDQVFPSADGTSLETYSYFNGDKPVMSLKGWVLKSVWK